MKEQSQRSRLRWIFVSACSVGLHVEPCVTTAAQVDDERAAIEQFEKEVRPLLVERCAECHGPQTQKSGLRVDSLQALLEGGESGPALIPGNPDESLVIEAVRQQGVLKMPPKSRLSAAQIESLTRWVEQGAPWPGQSASDRGVPERVHAPAGTLTPGEFERRAAHWAFQPLRMDNPPHAADNGWSNNPIDEYIFAQLENQNIPPAPAADRRTLIRRLSFDLLGLPPSLEEIHEFSSDQREDALPRLVDRYLASPHYGERWARHWLDLVRYAETSGHEFDYDIPFAWRYRDYVIGALNADLPYDVFVIEQIAGDLLKEPRRSTAGGENLSVVGTGWYLLGDGTHSPVDVREEQVRRIENQLDVFGKAFLGLTIACARCHDHKFDPISQRDYYALAGYMKSARHQYAVINEESLGAILNTLVQIRNRLLERLRAAEVLKNALECHQPRGPARPAEGAVLFEDFLRPSLDPWTVSGLAFTAALTQAGAVRMRATDAEITFTRVPEGVAHSGLVSDRLSGVLRSPSFNITHRYVHYLASGHEGRIQVVLDGFEKIREPIYGGLTAVVRNAEEPAWIRQDLGMWMGQRAYIEFVDGGAADFTQSTTRMHPAEGWLAVDEVWFSDSPNPPEAAGAEPPPPWPRIRRDALNEETRVLLDEFLAVEAGLPESEFATALQEGTGDDEFLLIRGNPRTPGHQVPRRYLEVFEPSDASGTERPGDRLELARRMVSIQNPLAARVVVNRLWQHHFGHGLVSTPDDFGHMGQPPSHPELLDWLARELIRSGWSLKHIHRLIVTSQAYQMCSLPSADADEHDPANRAWHRREPRRLEPEALRDTLLHHGGTLRQTMGGPSIPPYLTPFMEGRGRPAESGPLDGAGRRSIYLNIRRNFLPGFLLAFDFPTPATTVGRRNASNVPAQALVLLNDPFIQEQAELWANRLLQLPGLDHEQRIDRLYEEAFGRLPDARERAAALNYLSEFASHSQGWNELVHALISVKEFLYIP